MRFSVLKGNLDFKFHRLADVRIDLETGRGLSDTTQGRALHADLDFQEGRYDEARRGYDAVINDDLTWDNLARLAYFKWKLGDTTGADDLYAQAEDELTAKEMRHYAWIELQRGVLDLRQGRYQDAQAHYDRADHAYSGYWLVDDHKAELLGAQGRAEEAAQLYEKVIARAPKPELQQALGELYDAMGQSDKAEACYDKTLAAYLDSAECGDVHFYHHLVDFYADVREQGTEAVKWARKDIELRRNFSTLAALAWALYRADEFVEARDTMTEALASGVTDAEAFEIEMLLRCIGGLKPTLRAPAWSRLVIASGPIAFSNICCPAQHRPSLDGWRPQSPQAAFDVYPRTFSVARCAPSRKLPPNRRLLFPHPPAHRRR